VLGFSQQKKTRKFLAPSSSGLGRRPLKAVARVQIPSGLRAWRSLVSCFATFQGALRFYFGGPSPPNPPRCVLRTFQRWLLSAWTSECGFAARRRRRLFFAAVIRLRGPTRLEAIRITGVRCAVAHTYPSCSLPPVWPGRSPTMGVKGAAHAQSQAGSRTAPLTPMVASGRPDGRKGVRPPLLLVVCPPARHPS
jgi:hypothetical protein